MKNQLIKTIAFDADDTLWVNEPLFINTREECESILSAYIHNHDLEKQLYATEIRNLKLFGYGIKGFILSMIETAIELSNREVSGDQIQKIIDMGKAMIAHPIELIPNVEEVIIGLKSHFNLMIITKGDLFDQESKIARSGLAVHFDHFEIVSEKTVATYEKIVEKYKIDPEEFLMVGNSLRSDILPVCHLGAQAVHIPFQTTWEYEKVNDEHLNDVNYHLLPNIGALPKLLTNLTGHGS